MDMNALWFFDSCQARQEKGQKESTFGLYSWDQQTGVVTNSVFHLFLSRIFVRATQLKILDLPEGQINDPSTAWYFSLLFLIATPSASSQILERLFELTGWPSRALDSPWTLLPELQRNNDIVRRATLGAEVLKDTIKNNWHKIQNLIHVKRVKGIFGLLTKLANLQRSLRELW